MSGILGIFRFDGEPVEGQTLSDMRNAMSWYGPDGMSLWHDGSVGLGHLLLRVTPEDSFETQPLVKGPITMVCYARLDNRDELLCTLEIGSKEQIVTPDSALVMEAYLRWGKKCVHHLDGDWQFAAWDSVTRSLFLARDHFGMTGLYYYHTDKIFAFASNINGLLALQEVPRRPDMIRMAQVLTAWMGEGWRTGYEEIVRLMPAHQLLVTNNKIVTNNYWHPKNFAPVKLANDQEYVEHFLEIYEHAVRVRLRSARPVAATLSGGFDSGSIVALAAPMLAAQGKRLTAFTSVPHYNTSDIISRRTGDEWKLASATSAMAGNNIDHVQLKSENANLIASINHQIGLHCEPGHASSNHYWIEDLYHHAQSRGAGVMLSGQFGNFTVSYNGNGSLYHAISTGGLNAAYRMLRNCESTQWLAIKRLIFKPLFLQSMSFLKNNFKVGTPSWHEYSALKSEFAKKIQIERKMFKNGHDPTFYSKRSVAAQQSYLLQSSIGARWHETGSAFGLEVRDPTADRKVIEFCMGLPDEQYRRNSESRWLMKRSMAGRMPDCVLNNNQRGLQAADLVQRVYSNRRAISDTLNSLKYCNKTKEILDLPRIDGILAGLDGQSNLEYFSDCSSVLLRGIGVGLFLSRF